MDLVSVIVCTHNRAALLPDTLGSLREAMLAYGAPVEAIVVNNNSSDDTRVAVEAIIRAHPEVTLTLIDEPRPGLSAARNAGIRRAGGSLLCFLDDDVLVPAGWLTAIVEALALGAQVGGIAGRIKLSWPTPHPPAWIDAKYYSFYSQYDQGDVARLLPPDKGFVGANFALTRAAIERVGIFSTKLGRVGTNLLSGEEDEYAARLRRQGFDIAYAADGYVHHRVAAERLTFRWLWRRSFWQGVTVSHYPRNQWWGYPFSWLPKLLSNALLLPFALCTGNIRFIYRTCFRIANALGPFYGRYGYRSSERIHL